MRYSAMWIAFLCILFVGLSQQRKSIHKLQSEWKLLEAEKFKARFSQNAENLEYTVHYFDQIVDHFTFKTPITWR